MLCFGRHVLDGRRDGALFFFVFFFRERGSGGLVLVDMVQGQGRQEGGCNGFSFVRLGLVWVLFLF